MKPLTILLALAFAILIASAPVAPFSARTLSIESSDEAPFGVSPPSAFDLAAEPSVEGPSEIDQADSPDLPGFAGMLPTANSTASERFSATDFSDGIQFDGGTCKHVTLGGGGKIGETTLEAKCVDRHGTWWDTGLNLNDCAANHHGLLVFREEGNFDRSCRSCVVIDPIDVEGLQLKCKCINQDKDRQYALLPLGPHVDHPLAVKPVDGRLTCGKTKGTQAPIFFGS